MIGCGGTTGGGTTALLGGGGTTGTRKELSNVVAADNCFPILVFSFVSLEIAAVLNAVAGSDITFGARYFNAVPTLIPGGLTGIGLIRPFVRLLAVFNVIFTT
jgi:hypothetical protein